MIKNYLKISYRHLLKNYVFSLINILGLAIGLTFCLLIFQYVSYETSYDNFHPNAENIYRVRAELYENGNLTNAWATACAGLAPAMKEEFPDVVDFARMVNRTGSVSYNNNQFRENRLMFAAPSIFTLFSFPLVRGNTDDLAEPGIAFISESMARKYFGDGDPVGKIIRVYLDQPEDYMVKGIFKDVPANSHLKFDFLLSYQTLINRIEGENGNSTLIGFHYYIYVLFKPNANLEGFEEKLNQIYELRVGKIPGILETYKNTEIKFRLLPLRDIHLYSNFLLEIEPNSSASNVYFLLVMALFVLFIASINYIILSAAKAGGRLKEIGMRQILGASRRLLVKQYLFESLLPAAIALVMIMVLIGISIPFFNQLSGMGLTLSIFLNPVFWLQLVGIFLFIFALSVIFPAFILPAINPITALKGNTLSLSRRQPFRKTLVIFQYMAAIFLISSTIIIYQQLAYLKSIDLGFDIQNSLVLRGPRSLSMNKYLPAFASLKQELRHYPEIKSVSISSTVPGMKIFSSAKMLRNPKDDKDSALLYGVFCDYDYLPAYGVKLLTGRYFSEKLQDSFASVILSKSAARALNFNKPEDALDQQLFYIGGNIRMKVVGVSEDYCQTSLNRKQDPIFFYCVPIVNDYLSIKIDTKDVSQVISKVKAHWDKFFPNEFFSYFFLDDFFNRQYKGEYWFGKVFGLLAVLSIMLASLGILGLTLSNAVQKTKEIGIRKAVGAHTGHMLVLLYKNYLLLIVAANVVAWPLVYLAMDGWLKNFAHRIAIGWMPFVVSALAVGVIALLTVSYHVVTLARSNPVLLLKYE